MEFHFKLSINKSVFEDVLTEKEKSMLWLEGEIMEETLKYLTKRTIELEEQNNSIMSHNLKLRSEVKELKEKFKEIKRLIDEDYFEDGSFDNEYYVKEILNEVLKGDSDGKNSNE